MLRVDDAQKRYELSNHEHVESCICMGPWWNCSQSSTFVMS
jgi:hypothetical protein